MARIASEIDQHQLRTVVQIAIEQHARAHHRELDTLNKVAASLRSSKRLTDELKVCDELKTWFVDHVIGPEAQVKTILQSTRHLDQVE